MSTLLLLGFGSLIILVFLGLGLYTFANPTRTANDRLGDLTGIEGRVANEQQRTSELIAKRIAALTESKKKDSETDGQIRTMLIQAGYREKEALQLYNSSRLILAVVFPLLGIPFISGYPILKLAASVLGLVVFGYFVPFLVVSNARTNRQGELVKSFPDALDLLVTCVESGLALDAAIKRVATEMQIAAPLLAMEMMMIQYETNAGVQRVDALKHFGERTGVPEIEGLVNMLVQADRFGTSVANSLRVQSNLAREKRMARAEAAAGAVAPKLTVIMIIFFLPTLMAILLGPAIINAINQLG